MNNLEKSSASEIKDFIVPKYTTILEQPLSHPDCPNDAGSAVLIPKSDLERVIHELESTLVPCELHHANHWGKKMIGMYPMMKDIADPQSYADGIKTVFLTAPRHMLPRIVDELTRKYRFPPTRADVASCVDSHIGKHAAMLRKAKRMKQEHSRREQEKLEEEKRLAERAEFKEKYGENWFQELMKSIPNIKSQRKKVD